jgi:hypothetical protein
MSAKVPPKPSKDTIYVDVDNEITGIIDKVENSDHKVVALVLPKRAASLQSIVNMKLLKRSADTAGKNVVLITSEQALLPLAGAAGLHVAKNLQSKPEIPDTPAGAAATQESAEEAVEAVPGEGDEDLPKKIDYGAPIGALALAHEAENPETIDLEDEDAKAEAKPKSKSSKEPKISVPNFDRFRMLLGLGGAALVALIIFIILALFVLPKAKITIQTSSEPVSANFKLNASPTAAALDSQKNIIPAKLESTDQTGSQSVQATGQQNNGDKAAGDISFSIPCSSVSGSPPTVPAGTGVSANGLSYITQSNASLTTPAFSPCRFTGSSTIKSVAPGSKYNITTSSFTVSGYSNVSASGSASGGTDNLVTVLSQHDVDTAKDKLTSGTNGDQFTKDFEKKLTDQGEYVLTSSLKAGEAQVNASPAVGQPASTSNVTIKVNYTVLTVKKSDLSQAIQDKLAGQIDKSKQKLSGNYLNDATISVESQPAPNAAVLTINEDTAAIPIIDVAAVKKAAKGKKSGDVKAVIDNWGGVKNVDVQLSPFWVSKVPSKDKKITVVLKEVKDNSSGNSAP